MEEINKLDKLDYYNNIIYFNSLRSEILSWNKTLDYFKNSDCVKVNSILSISKLFHENKLAKDFPQIENLLRIYIALPISSAYAERALSAKKRLTTYLRNLTNQNRVSSLALISNEKEILSEISINDVIDQFGSIKDLKQFF